MSVAGISLRVRGLNLSRGEIPLISDLSFDLGPGQALWLTGPNGIGKTTILLALAGLIPPDEGYLEWSDNGQGLTPDQHVAYSAHRGPDRDGLLLGEELSFWQTIYRDKITLKQRLEGVGLSGSGQTPISGLSAGQRKRLDLARILASQRPVWLMDEPLAGLDVDGRELVLTTLQNHLKSGHMAIIASHQPVVIDGADTKKLVLEAA